MKTLKAFIFFTILFLNTSINISSQENNLNLKNFCEEVFLSLKTKNFDKYFTLHSIQENNSKQIFNIIQKYLISKYQNPETAEKKYKELLTNFDKHKNNLLKKVKLNFNTIVKSFKNSWAEAKMYTFGINNLKFKLGKITARIYIYFKIKNLFYRLIISKVIIINNEIYLCDSMKKVKRIFTLPLFPENQEINTSQ